MKTLVKVNLLKEEITMTKATARKASSVGSKEYEDFLKAKRDFPTFAVKVVSPETKKPRENQNKDLKIALMREIIAVSTNNDEKAIEAFDTIRASTKGRSGCYTTPKAYFLERYPNWRNYLLKVENYRKEEAERQTEQQEEPQASQQAEAAPVAVEVQEQREGTEKLFGVFGR